MHNWTDERNELIRRIWVTGESIKPHLNALGNPAYSTVISHAHLRLKLGGRPKTQRGHKPYAWDMVKAELKNGPGTVPELVNRTGLTHGVVNKSVRLANPGPESEIHVIDWQRRSNGGRYVAVYAIGPGVNATMPVPFTPAEKDRKAKVRRRKKNVFATAAGLVLPSSVKPGRVHRIADEEREAA